VYHRHRQTDRRQTDDRRNGDSIPGYSERERERKDLPKVIQSQSMQFADDLTVSEQGRDIQHIGSSRFQLLISFEDIKSYCKDRELIVNASKTQLIIISKYLPGKFQLRLPGYSRQLCDQTSLFS